MTSNDTTANGQLLAMQWIRRMNPDAIDLAGKEGRSSWVINELREYTVRNILKGFLTTGDVSFFCKVASRTVSKWCDKGVLPSIRVADSLDRRVKVSDFIAFCRTHGYEVHPILLTTHGTWVIHGGQYINSPCPLTLTSPADTEVMSLIQFVKNIGTTTVCPQRIIITADIDREYKAELLDLIQSNICMPRNVLNILSDDTNTDTMAYFKTKFPNYFHMHTTEMNWNNLPFKK